MNNQLNRIYANNQSIMINLYGRWKDEKDHEDIEEYAKVIKKKLEAEEGVKFIKMYKRPFSVTFRIGNEIYRLKVNSSTYECKRL